MRVTLQTALGVTVGLLVAGKVPDDQVLVATTGEQHVGAAERIVRNSLQNQTPSNHKIKQSMLLLRQQISTSHRNSYFSKEVARQVTQPL